MARLEAAVGLLPHWAGQPEWHGRVVVTDEPQLSGEPVTGGAADVARLLELGLGARLDEPARELVAMVADEFAGRVPQCVHTPLADGLALAGRLDDGRTLRLALEPRPSAPEPDERIARVNRLLGEYVSVGENYLVEVLVTFAEHGVDVDAPDRDAAVRAWWDEHGADLMEDEFYDEDDELETLEALDAAGLAAFRAAFEAGNLDRARSGAWQLGQIGDEALDDEPPRFPGDRLVAHLGRDLVDTVVARVADGGPAPLVFGLGVDPDADFTLGGGSGCLVFVGRTEAAVLLAE